MNIAQLPDLTQRYQKLHQKNNFLNRLNETVPWEEFRLILEQVHQKRRKSNAGRKPFDVVLMFKLLILQKLYNLSDDQLEYQVNDPFSFMEFLGLSLADAVPDATTVWLFRQQLTDAGLIEVLFEQFENYLQGRGYQASGGQILDATLVQVSKQQAQLLLNWCSHINHRGYRNHPLTEEHKQNNRHKSKIRAKVENVFGAWVNEMGGKLLRSIEIERARANLGLRNLAYNLKRYVYLETRKAQRG